MNVSSSSSTTDGQSFVLEESSDEEQILKYVLDNEDEKRALESAMKLRQLREEKRVSSHRLLEGQERKKGSLREIAKKHTSVSTRIILLRTPSTMRRIFVAAFECEDTSSFA